MVRKQIVIDPEREKTLERLAEELELSQSEVIRQAIDGLAERIVEMDEREKAWNRLREMARSATDHGITDEHGRLKWTREELHERRGSR
jgi:predicted transcriptional regulator